LSAFTTLWLATCALGLVPGRGDAGDAKVDDLLGVWKLTYTSPDGKARECVLALYREGSLLKGDYSVGKSTRPANNVGFERGELSFWIDGEYAGQVYTLTYKGKPRGEALRGAVHWKFGWASGSFDFVGERIAQRVATNPTGPGQTEGPG